MLPDPPRGLPLGHLQNFPLPLKIVPISVTICRLETVPLCLQNLHGVSFQHKTIWSRYLRYAPPHEKSWLRACEGSTVSIWGHWTVLKCTVLVKIRKGPSKTLMAAFLRYSSIQITNKYVYDKCCFSIIIFCACLDNPRQSSDGHLRFPTNEKGKKNVLNGWKAAGIKDPLAEQ